MTQIDKDESNATWTTTQHMAATALQQAASRTNLHSAGNWRMTHRMLRLPW